MIWYEYDGSKSSFEFDLLPEEVNKEYLTVKKDSKRTPQLDTVKQSNAINYNIEPKHLFTEGTWITKKGIEILHHDPWVPRKEIPGKIFAS